MVIGWVAATSGSVHAGEAGSGLFGAPAYLSTSVKKNGAPHELIEGTRIRVKFAREDHDVIRWRSGCNHYGAQVDITPKRLQVGTITSTAIGCAKRFHRQDEWVASVFEADPKWARHGRRLRLKAGDDVIKLRRPS
jgi:heat shock protein HslJ